jgi:hypothetical protein
MKKEELQKLIKLSISDAELREVLQMELDINFQRAFRDLKETLNEVQNENDFFDCELISASEVTVRAKFLAESDFLDKKDSKRLKSHLFDVREARKLLMQVM